MRQVYWPVWRALYIGAEEVASEEDLDITATLRGYC